jgi:hypothetical protein
MAVRKVVTKRCRRMPKVCGHTSMARGMPPRVTTGAFGDGCRAVASSSKRATAMALLLLE